MLDRIVYTRPDNAVSVLIPAPEYMRATTLGGGMIKGMSVRREIDRFVEHGWDGDFARLYTHAIAYGGHTEAEAFDILRRKDVPKDASGVERWQTSELPGDRWFRDAWRRSHNGGPISVDLERARPVQSKRLLSCYLATKNGGRIGDYLRLEEIDLDQYERRIERAADEDELRAIWPVELQ